MLSVVDRTEAATPGKTDKVTKSVTKLMKSSGWIVQISDWALELELLLEPLELSEVRFLPDEVFLKVFQMQVHIFIKVKMWLKWLSVSKLKARREATRQKSINEIF